MSDTTNYVAHVTGIRWSKTHKWARKLDMPVLLAFSKGSHMTIITATGEVFEVARCVNPPIVTKSPSTGGMLALTLRLGCIPGGLVGKELRRRLDSLREDGWCVDGDIPDDLKREEVGT